MSTYDRGPTLLLGALVLVILIGTVLGGTLLGPGMMGPGMMWGYGNPGAPAVGSWAWGLTMGFGMLMMLAFWAALIVGAVLLARWAIGLPRGAGGEPRPEASREILRRRYAAGEIDQGTYQQIKAELDGETESSSREAVNANGERR